MGWLAAQGAIMAIGLFIGLTACETQGSYVFLPAMKNEFECVTVKRKRESHNNQLQNIKWR